MIRNYVIIGLALTGLLVVNNVVKSAISLFLFNSTGNNRRELSPQSVFDAARVQSFYSTRHELNEYQHDNLSSSEAATEKFFVDNNTEELNKYGSDQVIEIEETQQNNYVRNNDTFLSKQQTIQGKRTEEENKQIDNNNSQSIIDDAEGKIYLRKPAKDRINSESIRVDAKINENYTNDDKFKQEKISAGVSTYGGNDVDKSSDLQAEDMSYEKDNRNVIMGDTRGVETEQRTIIDVTVEEQQPSTKEVKQIVNNIVSASNVNSLQLVSEKVETATIEFEEEMLQQQEDINDTITPKLYSNNKTNNKKFTSVKDITSCSRSIKQYIKCANVRSGLMILMKWDENGILDVNAMNKTISNSSYKHWFRSAQHILSKGKPNSVALFLNTDMTGTINWTIKPPIPLLSFSIPINAGKEDNIFVLPNPYDIGDFNRFSISAVKKTLIPFKDRIRKIIWRGCLHEGDFELSRLKVIELGNDEKNHDWLDGTNTNKQQHKKLKMKEMSQYMYQLDLGGVSGTTWGGLRWKQCTGNLVFKADTWSKDWWHDTIEPWKHYIPVKEDLSDLYEKHQWAERHMDNAKKIAEAGAERCEVTNKKEAPYQYWENLLDNFPTVSSELIQEAERLLYEYDGPNILTSKNLGSKNDFNRSVKIDK